MTIPYVQSSASQEVPPPYYFPGVTAHAFVWEAEMDCVSAHCDRFFNLGTAKERGFVYKPAPAWPYAILLLLDYPMMISTAQQSIRPEVAYDQRGYVKQFEVFVAFPVVRYGTTPANLAFATTVEFAIPFIAVGNAMSAVCGREMIGLPKLLAEIKTGEGEFPESFTAEVHLPGWPTPDGTETEEPFLRINTAPVLPTYRGQQPASTLWSLFQSREAGWAFDESSNAANGLNRLSAGLMASEMRTISLKQIRDARDPSRAVYQALVSCLSRYSNVREFSFYNEKDVHIDFFTGGSFRHVVELFHNVPPPDAHNVRHALIPKAAFRFVADIDFGHMRTIHTFAVDRGPGLAPVRAESDLAAPWARPWLGLFRGAHR